MGDLRSSFAMTPDDRVLPLITGEVKPAGITLDYQGMPGAVPGVFYNQLKFQRYDVSEMSFSSFLVERTKGWPYLLLPVFHNRNFFYTTIVILKSSGIRQDHPEDLKGKRFAVGDYQQSAAMWIRGVLLHEYGITPQDMDWVQTRGENYSHTGASGTKPPVNISYATKPASELFLSGELGAAMTWLGMGNESALERQGKDLRGDPDYTYLFSDPKAEAIRYFNWLRSRPARCGTCMTSARVTSCGPRQATPPLCSRRTPMASAPLRTPGGPSRRTRTRSSETLACDGQRR